MLASTSPIFSVASMPSMPGMEMSMRTMSGWVAWARASAWAPSSAAPTTSMSSWLARMSARPLRISGWSSAIRTRIGTGGSLRAWQFEHKRGPATRLAGQRESPACSFDSIVEEAEADVALLAAPGAVVLGEALAVVDHLEGDEAVVVEEAGGDVGGLAVVDDVADRLL